MSQGDQPKFILSKFDRDALRIGDGETWTQIGRFATLEAAWAAGCFLKALLPDELEDSQEDWAERPLFHVTSTKDGSLYTIHSSCDELGDLVSSLVVGLVAAKSQLDAAKRWDTPF